MIIDKKGRLFGKLNVIDLIVILILGVGAVMVGIRLSLAFGDISKGTYYEITYSFSVEEVRTDVVSGVLEKGETVSDRASKCLFGTLEDFSFGESRSLSVDSDGKYFFTTKPGYCSVQFTVKGKAYYKEGAGITIDNTEFLINRQLDMRVGKAVLYCRLDGFELGKVLPTP